MLQDRMNKFCRHYGDDSRQPIAGKITSLITRLLENHPDQAKWLEHWQKTAARMAERSKRRQQKKDQGTDHGPESSSSSSAEEEDNEEMAWRDGCALEEIAEANEFKEQRRRQASREARAARNKKLNSAALSLKGAAVGSQEPEEPADGNIVGSKASGGDAVGAGIVVAPEPSTVRPAEPSTVRPDTEMSARDASRVSCSIPWLKRYTPGHTFSFVQVPDFVQTSRIHCDFGPGQWFAKYEVDPAKPMPKEYQRQSRTKKYKAGDGQSEHQSFQTVLAWIWGKHASMAAGTVYPEWVTTALKKCPHCTRDLPCRAMADLWASPEISVRTPRLRTATPDILAETPPNTAATEEAAVLSVVGPTSAEAPPGAAETGAAETAHGSHAQDSAKVETAHGSPAKRCEVCEHWTEHTVLNCPLVMQASGASTSAVGRAQWSARPGGLPRVELPGAQLLRVPGDGNCMFTAYWAAVHATVHGAGALPDRTELKLHGRATRKSFLARVEAMFRSKEPRNLIEGLPAHRILLDVEDAPDTHPEAQRRLPAIDWPEAQEYLRRMQAWGTRESWGGHAELAILARMSGRQIYLVERHSSDNTWQLFVPPLGGKECKKASICVAWDGGHFDAVSLPLEAWPLLHPAGTS